MSSAQAASGVQCCAVLPLHRREPGEQTPSHFASLQMNGQGADVYCPLVAQVSRTLAEHRVLPGTQIPPHWAIGGLAPVLTQASGHIIAALTQLVPLAQVCTVRPLHWVAPIGHDPPHTPSKQAFGQVGPSLSH